MNENALRRTEKGNAFDWGLEIRQATAKKRLHFRLPGFGASRPPEQWTQFSSLGHTEHRAGGAVARRIEFLVELVPNGEYSFALAGGLKLLCTIRYLTKAEIRLYSHDQELRDKSDAVSVCFQQRVAKIDKNVQDLRNPLITLYFLLAGIVRDFPCKWAPSNPYQPRTQRTPEGQFVTEDLLESARVGQKVAINFVPTAFNQEQIGIFMSDNGFINWLRNLSGAGYDPPQFFCGLRSTSDTVFDGADGLMRSLTMQLLHVFSNTSFPISADTRLSRDFLKESHGNRF
ncbi:hypothetical protein B0I35DRAFT_415195 [Stachybotrys elegans]|uniref:Uncharacterized protein n=1 Tax=Stachybotrys elegans TaxID=80388 RepID=A0A8K0WIR1_9HYPO|nr:hypothetical protein B0I35DRAFT_415195 [Stachybotrys elegans]